MVGDNVNKVEINAHDGAQINIALGNGIVNAEQNNGYENSNNSPKTPIIFQNNKKQDYIKTWNSRMFLHIDDKENPLTLADAFIMPDYIMHNSVGRIGFSRKDILDKIIDKFIKYDMTSTMLITGVPGIGKTSITSWIANRYKDDDNVIILRFRDWEYEELNSGLLKSIYNTLVCKKKDLENKILVLDGFDEIKALDRRDDLLSTFINKMKDFNNLKCIITSRPVYINSQYFKNVFELKEFDIGRVENFYKTITGTDLKEKGKIVNNLEVLGIPVILYMAVMSDVDISENPTKPELYNRIFAETGGIFDKFSYEGTGYSLGEQIFRNPENTKIYLQFLREVAIRMFEKDSLILKTGDYEVPELKFEKGSVSVLEFPIKHLFENAETDIEFIHKSIYEYFMSEYIFESLRSGMEKQCIIEDIAGILGKLLRYQVLSSEIIVFFKYRIKNNSLNESFDIVNDAFQLMLKDGMTYYVKGRYKNVLKCEINIFKNMLQILYCFGVRILGSDELSYYIRHAGQSYLNLGIVKLNGVNLGKAKLNGVNLGKANLKGVNLEGADLTRANLEGADLTRANLEGADLTRANLEGADLTRANLEGADLKGADLKGADLRGADLRVADLRVANIHTSVWDNNDIEKVRFKLYDAIFRYIIIKDQEERKVYRKELFYKE